MGQVSIITPAYKAEEFLGKAIQSVQEQDFTDWEMLVVDDGSPDNTAKVAMRYAVDDPRVVLLRQENKGPALARQNGISVARGRYIAFLDSDDYWLPYKLSRQLSFMRERQAALSYTRFRRITADCSEVGHLVRIQDRADYWGLLKNTTIATSTVIVDRRLTGPFSMTQTYYDDYVLWLELLRRGHVAHGLQDDLMRYRVVGHSVSRNKLRSAAHVWRIYRKIERLNMAQAAWAFANYAYNATVKYKQF